MGTFIFILVIVFILWPLLKFGFKVGSAVHTMKKEFKNQFGNQQSARDSRNPFSQQKRRKKAIDPNVGEYVEFEEFKEERHIEDTTAEGTTSIDEESMVSDAEFEEIK